MRSKPVLSVAELPTALAEPLALDDQTAPAQPVLFVSLDSGDPPELPALDRIVIGVATGRVPTDLHPVRDVLTCTLVTGTPSSRAEVRVDDVDATREAMTTAIGRSPRAALTLVGVLDMADRNAILDGLRVESLAYSMLLAGPEFLRWRASRAVRAVTTPTSDAVLIDRDEATLHVLLNRPERHNAFDVGVRDGLVGAFDLAAADPTIERVVLRGVGISFCSGGDLDEFGSTPDVATAHLIRLDRGVGARVHQVRDRVIAEVHGACIGAGIEIPAFATHVRARGDAHFQLPEIAMGLIPGAGGTVSITRRIGRWRTAYLALSGGLLDVDTALSWGLVDSRS